MVIGMDRYAILENGIVVNLTFADADFAAEQGWIAAGPNVEIGWTHNGQRFSAPVVPLADAKVSLWTRAKALRDAKINAGVAVAGVGTFDSDDASRLNLTGASVMALAAQAANQPFSINWKLADNSIVTLNAAQMIQIGVAVGAKVSAIHARAQAIGLAIEAATTRQNLEAIQIGEGWP